MNAEQFVHDFPKNERLSQVRITFSQWRSLFFRRRARIVFFGEWLERTQKEMLDTSAEILDAIARELTGATD